jgi:hypothetical protein
MNRRLPFLWARLEHDPISDRGQVCAVRGLVPQIARHVGEQLSLLSVNTIEMIVFEHDASSFVVARTVEL